MNYAKDTEKIDMQLDLAGLAHIYKAYIRGVKSMILSDRELRRSAKLRELCEQMLIGSGYMSELEVRAMSEGLVIQRYLTQEDAKIGG
jgi:hypothetical protein